MSSHNGRRPPPEASCIGKSPFGTYKLAKEAARRMRQNRNCNVEAYKCSYCGNYHAGQAHRRRKPGIVELLRREQGEEA